MLLVFGAPCQLQSLAGQEHGRTIPLTDDLVSYRMVAAGDQARRLTLYVPQYGRVSLHPLAAVDHKQAIDGVRLSFGDRIARRATIARYEVDVIPIDDLDLAPAIIKIDAEGAESSVLVGASRTISAVGRFLCLRCAGMIAGRSTRS